MWRCGESGRSASSLFVIGNFANVAQTSFVIAQSPGRGNQGACFLWSGLMGRRGAGFRLWRWDRGGLSGRGDLVAGLNIVGEFGHDPGAVSYTHLRAHETRHDLVCRLLL